MPQRKQRKAKKEPGKPGRPTFRVRIDLPPAEAMRRLLRPKLSKPSAPAP